MTDTTTARRQLLDLLLDRVERGALLDNEAPLLRPLVLAEQADATRTDVYREDVEASATRAEEAEQRAERAHRTIAALWEECNAIIRETETDASEDAHGHRKAVNRMRAIMLSVAGGLTLAPDDTPTATGEEPEQPSETPILDGMLAGYRAQHPADYAPTAPCRVMPTRTCPEAYSGPCGDRLCARFESDDPAPWTPEQPTTDAPSEPQP